MQSLTPEGALGATAPAVPVTAAEKAQVERSLRRLRGSAKKWLKFRKVNDAAAAGRVRSNTPARILAKTLVETRDWQLEQRIAVRLHALLSEVMDAGSLPNPDITKDPNSAVKLAEIVIAGKMVGELTGPSAQGAFFVIPMVVIGGVIGFTLMNQSNNDLELAAQRERNRHCEDGFHLDCLPFVQIAAISVAGLIGYRFLKKKGLA